MVCIHLGIIDKNLIPILIGSIFCILNRLLYIVTPGIYENPILTNICILLSRFLTVIPFIILKIRAKGIRSDANIKRLKTIPFLYKKQNSSLDKYKYILLSAIIYLIQSIFFVLSFNAVTNAWIWTILIATIFIILFSKLKLISIIF